jgi:hypothetical protein
VEAGDSFVITFAVLLQLSLTVSSMSFRLHHSCKKKIQMARTVDIERRPLELWFLSLTPSLNARHCDLLGIHCVNRQAYLTCEFFFRFLFTVNSTNPTKSISKCKQRL